MGLNWYIIPERDRGTLCFLINPELSVYRGTYDINSNEDDATE